MPNLKHPTEDLARETMAGLLDELGQVTNAENDDTLAPWERAEAICRELTMVCQAVNAAIKARPDELRMQLDRMGMSETAERAEAPSGQLHPIFGGICKAAGLQ